MFYSRKRCRRESSRTTARSGDCQGRQKLDDFVKSIMEQSAQVLNEDATMKKLQQKILDVIGPLSRLWKVLENIKNASDDTAQCLLKIKQYVF